VNDSPDPLAALAHELKTPLAAIIGYADAMRARVFGPLDEPYARSAETIHAAARHLLALVDNMAGDASRRGERFDSRTLVGEVLQIFILQAEESGITLIADPGDDPLPAEADPLALRQILINLIANALAATPRGGRVSVGLRRDGGDLTLSVADTGPGITSAEGIGLTLVRALCAGQGGALAFDSPPGGGTTAIVRLPVGA
jgi:cell cycle sensor histidine kinase DivJ